MKRVGRVLSFALNRTLTIEYILVVLYTVMTRDKHTIDLYKHTF